MAIFTKAKSFISESIVEMRKVNWPTRQQALRYTMIVIGISVGVAAFLGGIDKLVQYFVNKFII